MASNLIDVVMNSETERANDAISEDERAIKIKNRPFGGCLHFLLFINILKGETHQHSCMPQVALQSALEDGSDFLVFVFPFVPR